jgi:hypothetical protein
MRRIVLPLLSVVLLFGSLPRSRAADEDVKAILAKAVEAHGGKEALKKFKASQARNKGKINLPGLGEVDFTQEVAAMLPDKFKEVMELDIAGKSIKVVTLVNGDTISIEADGKQVPITDDLKKTMKDARYMMTVGQLVPLTEDKGFEFSSLGEIKVEGKPAVGVLVKSKGNKDLNLYFSKDTGLLVKLEHRTTPPGTAKEVTEERIILEYGKKDKNGFPMPKKVLLKHDGNKFLEIEVIEAKRLEKLDESLFKKDV